MTSTSGVSITASQMTFPGSGVLMDVSTDAATKFLSIKKPEEAVSFLANACGLEEYNTDQKVAIALELNYYALSFCREQSFNGSKAAIFLAIVKNVHEQVSQTSTPFLEKDFTHFKSLLLKHSVHKPPESEKIFEIAEIQKLSDYMTETYFRHYNLYKYIFGAAAATTETQKETRESKASKTEKAPSKSSTSVKKATQGSTEKSSSPKKA